MSRGECSVMIHTFAMYHWREEYKYKDNKVPLMLTSNEKLTVINNLN